MPKEVSSSAECQSNNNTCDIIIYLSDNSNERLTETYNIKLVEKYDESVENTIKKHTENLKKSYQIDDMGYINQLIHYNEIEKRVKSKLPKNIELILKNTICKATELRQNETEKI